MQTFLFYDLETTGLNPEFDQVLQFAAIRTNSSLDEIDRYQSYVKLSPDRVPSSDAVSTHKITPDMLDNSISEYNAIKHIHALMNQPNTCSIGYNTLAFDDIFLRFSYHRFLLEPYTHQYANGCSRADIFLSILPFYKFMPDAIKWPSPISLKLENLAIAQGINIGAAHDAMNDVLATVELARILYNNTSQWQYILSLFDKSNDAKYAASFKALWLSPKLGYDSDFMAPVVILGHHNLYKFKLMWRLDDPAWSEVMESLDFSKLKLYRKKSGENGFLWPATDKYCSNIIHDTSDIYNFYNSHQNAVKKYIDPILQEPYPIISGLDVDAEIYQLGFKSRDLKVLCSLFNAANLKEKIRLLEQFPEPYKTQAVRIIWREDAKFLPKNYEYLIQDYLSSIAKGYISHVGKVIPGNLSRMQALSDSNSNIAKSWFSYLQNSNNNLSV